MDPLRKLSIIESKIKSTKREDPCKPITLSSALIWQEHQFREKMRVDGSHRPCLPASSLPRSPYRNKQVIIILTTQRSGSTLLCDDLMSYLQLPYKPTETFIPLLQNYFGHSSLRERIHSSTNTEKALMNAIAYPATGESSCPVIHKIMIDYAGWISTSIGIGEESDSYKKKCYLFLEWIFRDCHPESKLIVLRRRRVAAQAVSRFINSMGFETHLASESQRQDFEKKVLERLDSIKAPEESILEHASILTKQNSLIDQVVNISSNISQVRMFNMRFEDDLVAGFPHYLTSLMIPKAGDPHKVVRQTVPTTGTINSMLLEKLNSYLFPA